MKFKCPVGAVRDTKELEYVVALHQTDHADFSAWADGSIEAIDVQAFLMSRYGIQATPEDVRNIIFKGLAGGQSEDESIDIIELVSILIIPLLLKLSKELSRGRGAKSWHSQHEPLRQKQQEVMPPFKMIEDILKDILIETTGGLSPPKLTREMIVSICVELDELDVLNNEELISEMLACATGGDPNAVLDVETFTRALTSDIGLYNTDNESRLSTTLDDIFPGGIGIVEQSRKEFLKTKEKGKETTPQGESITETAMDLESPHKLPNGANDFVSTIFTFASIDYVSDNILSWEHSVLVWLCVVFSYMFYMMPGVQYEVCDSGSFGCLVGNSIVTWIIIMLRLTILGTIFGASLSSGNSVFRSSVGGSVFGIASIIFLIFVPAFYEVRENLFLTTSVERGVLNGCRHLITIFGIFMCFLQFKNLATILAPKITESYLGHFIVGSTVKGEYFTKQAAIFKVHQLISNAYALHQAKDTQGEVLSDEQKETLKESFQSKSKSTKNKTNKKKKKEKKVSSRPLALQQYTDLLDETEEIGGYWWAWKGFLTGNLQKTEGVWLHSRLKAGNTIQFFAILVLFILLIANNRGLINELFPVEDTVVFSEVCNSTFDVNRCYFPYAEQDFYTGIAVCRDVRLEGEGCGDLFAPIETGNPQQLAACSVLDAATSIAASQVPSDLTCETIFENVIQAAQAQQVQVEFYNECLQLTELLKNEFFDEEIAQEDIDACQGLLDAIHSVVDASVAFSRAAFDHCLDAFGSLTPTFPSTCDTELLRAFDIVRSYEIQVINSTDMSRFCQSTLGYCIPTADGTGICTIGELNLIPFQFEGPTCRDYPDINATLAFYDENVAPTLQASEDLMPRLWMVRLTLVIAVFTAITVALSTAMVYVPSAIHTVLKFRTGVFPSLRDPEFIKYRLGLQNTTLVIGTMFWGLLVSSLMVAVLVAGAVFLTVWQVTQPIVFQILATLIGILITFILKVVLTLLIWKSTHSGYYQRRPATANLISFALESWHLGLTSGFVVARLVKFLLCTGLYVGRIDRPVLADGLILNIDRIPVHFRQDLLTADAHRHPYLDLLGVMYMMKLRHGDDFGSPAGAAWRLLFVKVLMPWLAKKRIRIGGAGDDDNSGGVESFEPVERKSSWIEEFEERLQHDESPRKKKSVPTPANEGYEVDLHNYVEGKVKKNSASKAKRKSKQRRPQSTTQNETSKVRDLLG